MVDLVRKPGVEISQVITPTPVTPVTPTLAPCVVGPAYEVVEATNEGVANSAALVSGVVYSQGPLVIPASSFPTNHASIDEVSVIGLTDEISATLVNGSALTPLLPDAKSATLAHLPQATRPAIFFKAAPGVADTLKVSSSAISENNVDIEVGTTAAQLVELLTTLGYDAAVLSGDYALYVTLPDVSANYGPSAFLQIVSANDTAALNASSADIRVDGSGLYAEPAANADSTSFVKYSMGEFSRTDIEAVGSPVLGAQDMTAIDVADKAVPGWLTRAFPQTADLNDAFVEDFPDAVNFTQLDARPATALRDGDVLVTDGVALGMILNIRLDAIELGSVDTANSSYNADGSILAQRYVRDVRLTSSFSPTYAYIVARALSAVEADATVCGQVTSALALTTTLNPPVLNLAIADQTAGSIVLNGKSIVIDLVDDTSAVLDTFSITFGENFSMNDAGVDAIVSAINQEIGAFGTVSSVAGAAIKDVQIASAVKGGVYSLVFSEGASGASIFTATATAGDDAQIDTLQGQTISITLDDSPDVFEITAASDDVVEFIQAINDEVGYPLATLNDAHDSVTFRSALVGRLSHVSISGGMVVDGNDSGSGRPNPSILVDDVGTITLAPQIMRFARTGLPRTRAEINNGGVGVAVSYRGLRLDLSPVAAQPGLLQISDVNELVSYMSPVDSRNPLALAVYYALLNAGTGQTISALGVDDVSSSEPDGTVLSYMRAANFIEAHEVYAVVPLSQSEQVIEVFNQHVKDMSAPTGKRERVLISAPPVPTRETSIVASSGESAAYGQVVNVVDTGDLALAQSLEDNDVDTSGEIPIALSNGKELVLSVEVAGEQRNYSVKYISGSRVTVRVSGMSNTDGYYSTTSIAADFADATYSVFLRGAKLLVPGTNILDRNALATTVRDRAQQYANSRQLRLFPDSVQTVIGGVEQAVPMFYYGAAIAGATANLTAETPFSRRSMLGFTNVPSYDLTPNQLDMISAGNSVIEVEAPGLAPSIRIQSTTAPDAIETREYSIVKAVDSFAKQLRAGLKGRVGLFNITRTYLDETSTIADVICQDAVDRGMLASATITKLQQSTAAPDTILVEVAVGVLYPANTIKITLMV